MGKIWNGEYKQRCQLYPLVQDGDGGATVHPTELFLHFPSQEERRRVPRAAGGLADVKRQEMPSLGRDQDKDRGRWLRSGKAGLAVFPS